MGGKGERRTEVYACGQGAAGTCPAAPPAMKVGRYSTVSQSVVVGGNIRKEGACLWSGCCEKSLSCITYYIRIG